MANEFVAKNGLISQNNSTVTGSLTVTAGITGSLQGTASFASNANVFPFTGSAQITGSLNVTGSLTATQIGAGTTPSGSIRLDVRAQGALSTDIAFRVRNSANTYDIISNYGSELTIIGRNESTEPRLLVDRLGSTRILLGGTTDLNITFPSSGYGQINTGTQGLDIIATSGDIRTRNSSTSTILKGNFFGIGQATPAARLDVLAQGALSTDIAFRVRNSGDTANILSVNGDGTQTWFRPANNALSTIKSDTYNLIQWSNEAFGNIAIGYITGSSNLFTPTAGYNTLIGAGNVVSSSISGVVRVGYAGSTSANYAINIGHGGRSSGVNSIRIGFHTGASSFGGTNSIHIGTTPSGNDILADNVFMTYFNSQNPSTLARVNGSFGLLGQQSVILSNGTGLYGVDTHMGNGGNTLVVATHPSIPSSSITTAFQLYASTGSIASNIRPHFRTSNGTIVWLGDESRLFNVTASAISASSLTVTGGITGSLSGTSSFATSASFAQTASFITTAQTASYVLNAVSASYAPSNVTSTILYNSTSPVSVTGTTDETLIASVLIPTSISNTILRASFVVVVTTLGSAAPRTRMRIGTIANPTSVQLSTQTQLGTNAVGSANAVSMYRTMPVVGGSSGDIKVIAAGNNVNADYGTLTTYDTISVNWTTQQYIYFTIANNTTAAVTQCYGVLLEQLKQ